MGTRIALPNLIHMLPQLAILIGCIIYVSRVGGTASILLLVGEIILILSSILNIAFQLVMINGNLPSATIGKIMMVPYGLGLIGGILFAIGFITMAIKQKAGN
ncbi:MAG: hypothetical protein JXB49_19300 [Bacteroidales bacterium]|nr:hypothetical protein [Bacteroidales bacterium]